jgi:hypothetical protein
MHNTTLVMDVDEGETVAQFKDKCWLRGRIPVDWQRLSCNGKPLHNVDSRLLSDYVQDGDIVHLHALLQFAEQKDEAPPVAPPSPIPRVELLHPTFLYPPRTVRSKTSTFQRQQANANGYATTLFVDAASETVHTLTCVVCIEVVRHAVGNDACSHVFCKSCHTNLQLHAIKSGKMHVDCPTCRAKWTDKTTHTNLFVDRLVLSQRVRCHSAVVGHDCRWTGQLCDLERHLLGECEFETSTACADCNADDIVVATVDNHAATCPDRLVVCLVCYTPHKRRDADKHPHECPERLVVCPHASDCHHKSMPFIYLQKHLLVCPAYLVDCPYKIPRCRVRRDCVDTHTFTDDAHSVLQKKEEEELHRIPVWFPEDFPDMMRMMYDN